MIRNARLLAGLLLVLPLCSQSLPSSAAGEPTWQSLLASAHTASREDRELEAEQLTDRAAALVLKARAADIEFASAVSAVADEYYAQGLWLKLERVYDLALSSPAANNDPLTAIRLLNSYGLQTMEASREFASVRQFERAHALAERGYGEKSAEAAAERALTLFAQLAAGDFGGARRKIDTLFDFDRPDHPIPELIPGVPVESYDALIEALVELGSDFYFSREDVPSAEALLQRAIRLPVSKEAKGNLYRRWIRLAREHSQDSDHIEGIVSEFVNFYRSAHTEEDDRLAAAVQAEYQKTADESADKPPREQRPATSQSTQPAIPSLIPSLRSRAAREQALMAAIKSSTAQPDELAVYLEADLSRSGEAARALASRYLAAKQFGKVHKLLERWSEAVRARAGSAAPEMRAIHAVTVELLQQENDWRGAKLACDSWMEYEQTNFGPYAKALIDARFALATIYKKLDDPDAARSSATAAVELAEHWGTPSSKDPAAARARAQKLLGDLH